MGLFAPNLVNLLAVSLPNILECGWIFGSVRGGMHCESQQTMVCLCNRRVVVLGGRLAKVIVDEVDGVEVVCDNI